MQSTAQSTNKLDPQEIISQSPMSAVQITAVVMCILLNALDGYDVLSISFASPGIAAEWGIERAALGVVLSMELIGMAVGAVILGNMADKYGRRPTILGCLVVMSAGMLAAAVASGIVELSVYRFLTGLGIGGMLASTNAMVAEFSNARYRSLCVMLMAGGYPLGVVLGGAVASRLLETNDWRIVFHLGFGMTVTFILFVWLWLPESVSYLAKKRPESALERINNTLRKMKHRVIDQLPEIQVEKVVEKASIFSPELRRNTWLLTAAYFFHIMTFYFFIKWVPKIVVDMGYPASEAGSVLVWANLGSVTGCILLGLLSQRFNVRVLTMIVLAMSVIAVSLFGSNQESLGQLTLIAAVIGFCTNAAIVGLYALFARTFPTELRAGGTGFAIGLGRGGAALGPIAAGLLFASGLGLQPVAMIMAVGSLVALLVLCFLRTG